MTPTPDEICERLRDLRAYRTKVYNCAGDAVDAALSDAKATIERLSAALAIIERGTVDDAFGKPVKITLFRMRSIARAALGKDAR